MIREGDIVIVVSEESLGLQGFNSRPGIVTKVWSQETINVTILGDGTFDDWDVKKLTSLQRNVEFDPHFELQREFVEG